MAMGKTVRTACKLTSPCLAESKHRAAKQAAATKRLDESAVDASGGSDEVELGKEKEAVAVAQQGSKGGRKMESESSGDSEMGMTRTDSIVSPSEVGARDNEDAVLDAMYSSNDPRVPPVNGQKPDSASVQAPFGSDQSERSEL